MITSNGKRVFAQVESDLICYEYNEKTNTWGAYGHITKALQKKTEKLLFQMKMIQ